MRHKKSETTIELEELGIAVKVVKSSRLKRVNISIRPFEGVRVAAPYRVPDRHVRELVSQKGDWIKRHLDKVRSLEKDSFFDPRRPFKTHSHTLKMEPGLYDKISLRLAGGLIHVKYPALTPPHDPAIQGAVRQGIERALRKEARQYLPGRVEELAKRHGFSYNSVALKNAKTRWGSCSARGNINLNIHLMRLPQELRDYVILHELTHTVEPNHQKGFWAKLEEVAPGAKQLDKELSKHWIRF